MIRCCPPAKKRTSVLTPQRATSRPRVAPAATSTAPSVNSCLTSRPRLAPMARRTAISPRRALARARSRFATLAQPMSKTSPTMVMTIQSGVAKLRLRSLPPLPAGTSAIRSKYSRAFPFTRSRVMYAWNMPSRSARASSIRRVVFQPADNAQPPVLLRRQSVLRDGHRDREIHRRAGLKPRNARGVTPTIVTHVCPTWIALPRIDGLLPNRRSQSASLMTAGGVSGPPLLGGRSSDGVNTRP